MKKFYTALVFYFVIVEVHLAGLSSSYLDHLIQVCTFAFHNLCLTTHKRLAIFVVTGFHALFLYFKW